MDTLDRRALNRALLARQLLLRREPVGVPAALERLVALQAQAPNPPYVGLWTRIAGFRMADLADLVASRAVVRVALMRSTIHLVTAADCLALRPVLAGVLDRQLRGVYGRQLVGVDPAALAAAGRALVEDRPRTLGELGALLAERWPEADPAALANAVRAWVPLVAVPPRGIWGASGPAAHTSAESWLGAPLGSDPSPDALVLRYLAGYGPATVRDLQAWTGLTRLREVVDRLRPQLRTFRADDGAELVDRPDAPRPDGDTPAPARLLAEFDNVLLAHADRTRILGDLDRRRVFTVNGLVRGTVLVDGFVRGIWTIERRAGLATLVITPFSPLPASAREALETEAADLLGFAATEAEVRDVRWNAEPAAVS